MDPMAGAQVPAEYAPAPQQGSGEPVQVGGKNKKGVVRRAGGKTWIDPVLTDWPESTPRNSQYCLSIKALIHCMQMTGEFLLETWVMIFQRNSCSRPSPITSPAQGRESSEIREVKLVDMASSALLTPTSLLLH